MYAIYRSEGIEVAIPFECRMCGKCCERLSQCVYDPVEGKIIAETDLGLFEFVKLNVESKSPVLIRPCPFLKDGKCTIHEIRPESCREFPLTERGDCGVGCEAYREVQARVAAVEKALGKLEFTGRLD